MALSRRFSYLTNSRNFDNCEGVEYGFGILLILAFLVRVIFRGNGSWKIDLVGGVFSP